jgi:hypothetical protein
MEYIDGRTEVLEFAHHKSHSERPMTNRVNHGITIMFQFWLKLDDRSSKFTSRSLCICPSNFRVTQ